MRWYWQALVQYADFLGRANRKEYWLFILWNFIIGSVLELADLVLLPHGLPVFGWLYSLVLFIPELALYFRRLHDVGHSGWALLWLLLPIVGWIILFVYAVQPGQRATNAYGPPRYDWSPELPR